MERNALVDHLVLAVIGAPSRTTNGCARYCDIPLFLRVLHQWSPVGGNPSVTQSEWAPLGATAAVVPVAFSPPARASSSARCPLPDRAAAANGATVHIEPTA